MGHDINKEIFPYETWTPENEKLTADNLEGTYLKIRELWNNLDAFVSEEAEVCE